MSNRNIEAAWKYHEETKHSYWSVRNNPHFLDWANRPLPFKIYPGVETFLLPREVSQTGVAALSAIADRVSSSGADLVPELQDLTRILYFSAGITKQRTYPSGEIYFRPAACTGALYEIELYVMAVVPGGPQKFGCECNGDFSPTIQKGRASRVLIRLRRPDLWCAHRLCSLLWS